MQIGPLVKSRMGHRQHERPPFKEV